jgi:hypothetical protein
MGWKGKRHHIGPQRTMTRSPITSFVLWQSIIYLIVGKIRRGGVKSIAVTSQIVELETNYLLFISNPVVG